MMSDLDEREKRAVFCDGDATTKARREEEERIAIKLKEEIASICAMVKGKSAAAETVELKEETVTSTTTTNWIKESCCVDNEKIVMILWVKVLGDYSVLKD